MLIVIIKDKFDGKINNNNCDTNSRSGNKN